MNQNYFSDQTFTKLNAQSGPLPKGDYENCSFQSCDFSEENLNSFTFTDCVFNECNLSLAKLSQTAFRDCTFKNCKMLGLLFNTCNPFGLSFSFQACQLNHSSFYKTKIRMTTFQHCQLHGVDFSLCDLTSSVFSQCDLLDATFEDSILEKVDFTTAYHFAIDPELNRMKQARFSNQGLAGLLTRYNLVIEDHPATHM